MGGANDLSGDWIGFYYYDFPCPPTQFEAAIRDTDGLISGLTTETFEGPGRAGMGGAATPCAPSRESVRAAWIYGLN